jgi:hypothetical protein
MTKRSQRYAIVASALVVIVAAAAVATALASSKSHAARPHATGHAVSARLDQIFKVLRVRGHVASVGTGAQALPPAVVEGMSHQQGVDPSAAVFAGGTYPTWVVPGSTEVCLIRLATRPGDVPDGVCGSVSAAEHGLALTSESATGAPVVVGLVPDGNASVGVTDADGTSQNVPVTNNVYEITSGEPSMVSLREASGASVTRHLAIVSPPPPSAPGRSAAP